MAETGSVQPTFGKPHQRRKWPKYEREERKGREIEKREELKSKGDKNKTTVFRAGVEMLSTTLWVSCSALHTFKAEEWPC